MKAIFVHFYDLSPHSGISKKILYQISALKECGMSVELSYMQIDENGCHKRVCGHTIIEIYGNGTRSKFLKWFEKAKNKILYKEKMKNEFSKENMLNDFDR